MAAVNVEAETRVGEETSLLREDRVQRDGNTTNGRHVGVDLVDGDGKPNQELEVGRVRGLIIIMSLWGLIFLQGEISVYDFGTVQGNGTMALSEDQLN